MFQVGAAYRIKMLEYGPDGPSVEELYYCRVLDADEHLIKVRLNSDEEKVVIINTRSQAFVSASPEEP